MAIRGGRTNVMFLAHPFTEFLDQLLMVIINPVLVQFDSENFLKFHLIGKERK